MKCNFIPVNYNNSNITIDCIKTILNQKVPVRIVVVDNNSTLDEQRKLTEFTKKYSECIDVLFLRKNIGYFPAINEGILYLGESLHSNYTVVGNNDLEFPSDFFEKLNGISIKDKTFAIAPDIITPCGVHQNPLLMNKYSAFRKIMYDIFYSNYLFAQIILFLTQKLSIAKSKKNRIGFDVQQNIAIPHGACIILTEKFFENFNLLDDTSFLFGEEILFANQIKKCAGEVLYIPKLKVLHNEHSTINNMPSKTSYLLERKAYQVFKEYI